MSARRGRRRRAPGCSASGTCSDEDRLPRDQLREQTADRRPERRARDAGDGPHAHRALLAARELRQQLERRADRRGAAHALDGARPDQEAERRARARTPPMHAANTHEAAGAHPPGRPPRREPGRGHGRECDREVEGRDDPGHVGDLRVVLAVDRGQREDDDGGVRQHEADGERDRRDAQVRSACRTPPAAGARARAPARARARAPRDRSRRRSRRGRRAPAR